MNPFKKTELQEWRLKFWTDVNNKYQDLGFEFKGVKPFDRPYYYMSTEVPYLIFVNRINKGKGICKVEFYTEIERAQEVYENLVRFKSEIGKKVSFNIVWNTPNEKHRYFAIGAVSENFDFRNDKDRETAINWLAETGLELFHGIMHYFEGRKMSNQDSSK